MRFVYIQRDSSGKLAKDSLLTCPFLYKHGSIGAHCIHTHDNNNRVKSGTSTILELCMYETFSGLALPVLRIISSKFIMTLIQFNGVT